MRSFHSQLIKPYICDFTIACKGCGEQIPAPVQTLPSSWIIATDTLCGERRKYLPVEVFRGTLSHKLTLTPGKGWEAWKSG